MIHFSNSTVKKWTLLQVSPIWILRRSFYLTFFYLWIDINAINFSCLSICDIIWQQKNKFASNTLRLEYIIDSWKTLDWQLWNITKEIIKLYLKWTQSLKYICQLYYLLCIIQFFLNIEYINIFSKHACIDAYQIGFFKCLI